MLILAAEPCGEELASPSLWCGLRTWCEYVAIVIAYLRCEAGVTAEHIWGVFEQNRGVFERDHGPLTERCVLRGLHEGARAGVFRAAPGLPSTEESWVDLEARATLTAAGIQMLQSRIDISSTIASWERHLLYSKQALTSLTSLHRFHPFTQQRCMGPSNMLDFVRRVGQYSRRQTPLAQRIQQHERRAVAVFVRNRTVRDEFDWKRRKMCIEATEKSCERAMERCGRQQGRGQISMRELWARLSAVPLQCQRLLQDGSPAQVRYELSPPSSMNSMSPNKRSP